jgi:hypothetical protein
MGESTRVGAGGKDLASVIRLLNWENLVSKKDSQLTCMAPIALATEFALEVTRHPEENSMDFPRVKARQTRADPGEIYVAA